jgi:hypothetical protein
VTTLSTCSRLKSAGQLSRPGRSGAIVGTLKPLDTFLPSAPDGFLQLLGEATQVIDATTVEILNVVAGEDRVVLLMSARCVGHPEPVQITEHWVLKDDKVIDVRVFWYNLPFATY